MTLAELLKKHANDLTPQEGDAAYTLYRSRRYEGRLKQTDGGVKLAPHGLHVGYEAPIRFDALAGKFYAPADAD